MADIICRWRNGTPKTVVELVNSLPHDKMSNEDFRIFMQHSQWGSEFFHTPYQLACQLGLYCEAEDGFYYPRFDHDISENEAQEYLEYWLPRYYVPNPYVGRNGFNRIKCPTYVLFELYNYTIHHANCTYKEAYETIFQEKPTNNNDIVKNYINNYSKVLHFDANGYLIVTKENPITTFNFMDRSSKKDFFDNFSRNNEHKKINLPLQRIFYGSPGTGKSFSIKKVIAEHQNTTPENINMEADNIFRTTFHPDYDYAQFVGCYKPISECFDLLSGHNLTESELLQKFKDSAIGENKKARFLYEALLCQADMRKLDIDIHSLRKKLEEEKFENCIYDGESSVMAKIYDWLKEDGYLKESKINYSFAPQVFTNALVKAYESTAPVYLVIEEINRGNCAQIFGDLFQLLDRNSETGESEYSINVDEDLKKYLHGKNIEGLISKEGKIKLPSNFNIIATMNTSDQSLFPMDSAFKRRWEWEYVPIDYDNKDSSKFEINIGNKTYQWYVFLKAVNQKIKSVTKSEDKQMGNFFIKKSVNAKEFCNKVMFYLWNDISKDYYESNDSLFQYIDEDSKLAKHFSFNELFGKNQTELLKGFMEFIEYDKAQKELGTKQTDVNTNDNTDEFQMSNPS